MGPEGVLFLGTTGTEDAVTVGGAIGAKGAEEVGDEEGTTAGAGGAGTGAKTGAVTGAGGFAARGTVAEGVGVIDTEVLACTSL